MNRHPPQEVIQELRREVGFLCPVQGCGNPYLTWHHYDPPWNVMHHHNPAGMIALCRMHADKADAGAYTKEQLANLKKSPNNRGEMPSGKFEWMRRKLLAVTGGNFFFDTPVPLEHKKAKMVWFNRDSEGNLLLNVRLDPHRAGGRLLIEDSVWIIKGKVADIECPPSGKHLRVDYPDKDYMQIDFLEVPSLADLAERYRRPRMDRWGLPFPITIVEIHSRNRSIGLELDPHRLIINGKTKMGGNFASQCAVGILIA